MTHCLQIGNSFIPLFWWHTTTLPLLLFVLILILQISLFFLSKTSDRPEGHSAKCWCTVFSIPGSTRLEFTTFENPLLLVFVVIYVPAKNTSLPHRLSVGFFRCVYWTTLAKNTSLPHRLSVSFFSCVCILDNVSCMGCMFCREGERMLFYHFFSVSGWECLSLDVVSLSVERCCMLLFVDCMYINTF